MWDGLEGERDDHAGRRREARAPAAGAVREVVDGRETSHVFVVRTARQAESRRKRIVKVAPGVLYSLEMITRARELTA